MIRILPRLIAVVSLLLPATALAQASPAPASPTENDIQATFGVVPSFMKKGMPAAALPSAWDLMKAIELNPKAVISDKYLSLISFAVASQIPCRYCVIADREFAKVGGASEEELNEAVAMAAITRFWSTWLNGNQFDEAAFRKEADQIFANLRKPAPATPMARVEVTDSASALKDIQQTFGMVPTFLKTFPADALAPAWLQLKSVQLNPTSKIPGKYKELIGLGVAAQIPCHYCLYFHGSAARLNGASEAEIKLALTEASLTRYFSTVLNGYGGDEGQFRKEIQTAVKAMKKQKAAAAK